MSVHQDVERLYVWPIGDEHGGYAVEAKILYIKSSAIGKIFSYIVQAAGKLLHISFYGFMPYEISGKGDYFLAFIHARAPLNKGKSSLLSTG